MMSRYMNKHRLDGNRSLHSRTCDISDTSLNVERFSSAFDDRSRPILIYALRKGGDQFGIVGVSQIYKIYIPVRPTCEFKGDQCVTS